MSKTSIEWTEQTWNPLAGCKEISPGCTNCYAAVMAHRLAAMGQKKYQGTTKKLDNGKVVWTGKINIDPGALALPGSIKKPTTWFVNSMSDLFHEDVPDEFIHEVFDTMGRAHWHRFQVLTKRAARLPEFVNQYVNRLGRDPAQMGKPLPNVWLGVSVEDQQRADERIPYLLKTPAAVRFLSCEPLLGQVDLTAFLTDAPNLTVNTLARFYRTPEGKACAFNDKGDGKQYDRVVKDPPLLHWVIVGGESGHGARPCNVEHVRWLVRQGREAGVKILVKQLGAHVIDHGTTSAETFPEDQCWPKGTKTDGHRVLLRDRKGGDMKEWPTDLRVREMP